MSVWLIAALTGLGGLFLGVCSDMISEEMRGRLDRLPQALVRMAARRLPEEIRDDMAREWLAELHEVLHGAEAVPITRLFKGVGYGGGVLLSAPKFGKELGFHENTRPETSRASAAQANPPVEDDQLVIRIAYENWTEMEWKLRKALRKHVGSELNEDFFRLPLIKDEKQAWSINYGEKNPIRIDMYEVRGHDKPNQE
jgi:hypothetical protein